MEMETLPLIRFRDGLLLNADVPLFFGHILRAWDFIYFVMHGYLLVGISAGWLAQWG